MSWGHSLFRNRWILLMKSGDVKTQKQNYLVFFSTSPSVRIFLAPPCQVFSFSYLSFSISHLARAKLTSPEHLADISWAYGDTFFPNSHCPYRSTPWPKPENTPFARTRRLGGNPMTSFMSTAASCSDKRDAGAKYRFRATVRSPGSSGS